MKKIILLVTIPFLLMSAEIKYSLGEVYKDNGKQYVKEGNITYQIAKTKQGNKLYHILKTRIFKDDKDSKKCKLELEKEKKLIEDEYNIKFETYESFIQKNKDIKVTEKQFNARTFFKNKEYKFQLSCGVPMSLILIPVKLENQGDNKQLIVLKKSYLLESVSYKEKSKLKKEKAKKIKIILENRDYTSLMYINKKAINNEKENGAFGYLFTDKIEFPKGKNKREVFSKTKDDFFNDYFVFKQAKKIDEKEFRKSLKKAKGNSKEIDKIMKKLGTDLYPENEKISKIGKIQAVKYYKYKKVCEKDRKLLTGIIEKEFSKQKNNSSSDKSIIILENKNIEISCEYGSEKDFNHILKLTYIKK